MATERPCADCILGEFSKSNGYRPSYNLELFQKLSSSFLEIEPIGQEGVLLRIPLGNKSYRMLPCNCGRTVRILPSNHDQCARFDRRLSEQPDRIHNRCDSQTKTENSLA